MLTMQPSVTLGSYTWAQDRLPFDEFTLRLADLQAAMDQNGWKAVLAYGDVRDHAALAFLSNFIPRVRWGMALLPRNGDARLICAMSTRDLPAMRSLTWIADVRSGMGPEWVKSFDPWFEQFRSEPSVALGTLGFDFMAPALAQPLRRGLGDRFVLQKADDILALGLRPKRPRELTMMRASCEVLDAAVKTFAESWRNNRAPETAGLDAERMARSLAAQDVRTLVSLDGGHALVPFHGSFAQTAEPLVGYIAVKMAGYWADMFVTVNGDDAGPAAKHAAGALDAVIAAMRPGVSCAKLHAVAADALRPFALHPVLGESVGHGIGLSPQEGPAFSAAEDAALAEDGVYTVQVGTADPKADPILISAIVRNARGGPEVLTRSPPVGASKFRDVARFEMTANTETPDYDHLYDILARRMSIRRLKPDPIPDDYVHKVLEAGRWAMSGANSQPWEFVVVKDEKVKRELFEAYRDVNSDFIFWMEQMREKPLRHPAYQVEGDNPREQWERTRTGMTRAWSAAPVLIVILGDGRRQWGTVQGALTFGRHQSHLTDALANAATLMHLAAAALGLGSQHVTIHIEEPFKRVLGVPDLVMIHHIIPVGWPAMDRRPGVRRPLEDVVHYDRYDMKKYMSNEQIIDFLSELRGLTRRSYHDAPKPPGG